MVHVGNTSESICAEAILLPSYQERVCNVECSHPLWWRIINYTRYDDKSYEHIGIEQTLVLSKVVTLFFFKWGEEECSETYPSSIFFWFQASLLTQTAQVSLCNWHKWLHICSYLSSSNWLACFIFGNKCIWSLLGCRFLDIGIQIFFVHTGWQEIREQVPWWMVKLLCVFDLVCDCWYWFRSLLKTFLF